MRLPGAIGCPVSLWRCGSYLDKRSEPGLLCFFRCLLCGLLLGPLLLLLAGTLLGLLGCTLKYAPISIVTTTISHRQTDKQTDKQSQTQTHTHENTKGRGRAGATRQEKCFAIAQTPCNAQTSQRRALPPRKRGSRTATFRRTAFCSAAIRCLAVGSTALSLLRPWLLHPWLLRFWELVPRVACLGPWAAGATPWTLAALHVHLTCCLA